MPVEICAFVETRIFRRRSNFGSRDPPAPARGVHVERGDETLVVNERCGRGARWIGELPRQSCVSRWHGPNGLAVVMCDIERPRTPLLVRRVAVRDRGRLDAVRRVELAQ